MNAVLQRAVWPQAEGSWNGGGVNLDGRGIVPRRPRVAGRGDITVENRQQLLQFATAVAPFAVLGYVSTVTPFFVYAIVSQLAARLMSRTVPINVDPFWFQVGKVACFFAPVLVIDAWRATRALGPNRFPIVALCAPVSALATPLWLPYAIDEFGIYAQFAALIWWPIACLTPVGFVIAAAQIDASNRGETVRVDALRIAYHFGGFLGVELARRMFPASKAVREFPSGPPDAVVFVVAAIGIVMFTKIAPVLGVPK